MRFAPLEVENGLVFVMLWTVKVVSKSKKIKGSIHFLTNIRRFSAKKCLSSVHSAKMDPILENYRRHLFFLFSHTVTPFGSRIVVKRLHSIPYRTVEADFRFFSWFSSSGGPRQPKSHLRSKNQKLIILNAFNTLFINLFSLYTCTYIDLILTPYCTV